MVVGIVAATLWLRKRALRWPCRPTPTSKPSWELHRAVTAYDAWYAALAEALDWPLATLDIRLAAAPEPRCRFETPTA